MSPLYIFDLDGTLALIEHRLHFLENKDDQQRWSKFFEACVRDMPNTPVIRTMQMLRQAGADIWIFSGRSDEVLQTTLEWLSEHTSLMSWELETCLRMRPKGDYTADEKLKAQWIDEMLIDDRQRLVAVFEDRSRMVEMWRAKGIACFQVAAGNF